MERKLYKEFAEIYESHWWFRGRLKILESIFEKFLRPPFFKKRLSILDVGCGTGSYFGILSGYGDLFGTESDNSVIEDLEKRKVPAEIFKAELPHMDLGRKFDVITAFEILEHLENEHSVFKNIFDHLERGGMFIGTVPAYRWLWSKHDELAHHKRRYTKEMIAQRLQETGFTTIKISYYNTLLFPIGAVVRILKKTILKNALPVSDFATSSGVFDFLFESMFASERHFLKHFSFPFGFSLIFVAKKA